ncbi:MAG: TolC family protein [Melioribacteraceae bacterium]
MIRNGFFLFIIILIPITISEISAQQNNTESVVALSLSQCIEITLKHSPIKKISSLAVRAAEARIKQARSGTYPKIDATAGYFLMDQDPNFLFPEMSVEIPPINMGTFSISPGAFTVPSQNIKLADKQSLSASIEFLFPLYTGGKISSYISQAEAALEIAKSESRENDEQIIFETSKLYYASLLATKLEEIAGEAYDRLNSTLKLTDAAYKNGSGSVTRSDYLKNKTVAEAVKSILIQISGERKNALAALAHSMGLDWKTQIKISDKEFPRLEGTKDLETLINSAVRQNPLFDKVDSGLKVFESKIELAKSSLYPSVALFGNYRKIFNNYDYGMMSAENKNIWMVGVGLQLNIFEGLRTSGMIDEAKADYERLNAQKELLTKGISMKVQYLYNKLQTAKEKESASKEAMQSAAEDRELVEKAYFSDIMELKDLIQAQITESIMKAQYETSLYEWALLDAELRLVLAENNN